MISSSVYIYFSFSFSMPITCVALRVLAKLDALREAAVLEAGSPS
jgi:hypothetical protein